MFTQLIMWLTIALLSSVGIQVFQISKKVRHPLAKILSLGLFFVAFGILSYAVRDIFVQFGMYEIQHFLLLIGALVHGLGCALIILFLTQEFSKEYLKKIFSVVCILIILVVLGSTSFFIKGSKIIRAPFEFFPYYVVRNFPESHSNTIFFIISFTIGSLLLIGISLYNTLQLKEKKLKQKALLYEIGFLLLLFPMAICGLISPIYARWGYLLGAFLIYRAFKMKV